MGGTLLASPVLAQISGQLPPPPSIRTIETTPLPPNSEMPFVPIDKTFQAPANVVEESDVTGYRVVVNGDSALLLQQVQRVEPKAFLNEYKGRKVIQTGVFADQGNAEQQVALLRSQGIQAEVMASRVASQPTAGGYWVIVPGDRDNLSTLRAQIVQLGADEQAVLEKESPLGPHVQLGPFDDRQAAEEWNQLLRTSGGLDARVFYAR